MSNVCPRTQLWLHRTVHTLLEEQCRSVSTTSAINRGLRATRSIVGREEQAAGRDGPSRVKSLRDRRGEPYVGLIRHHRVEPSSHEVEPEKRQQQSPWKIPRPQQRQDRSGDAFTRPPAQAGLEKPDLPRADSSTESLNAAVRRMGELMQAIQISAAGGATVSAALLGELRALIGTLNSGKFKQGDSWKLQLRRMLNRGLGPEGDLWALRPRADRNVIHFKPEEDDGKLELHLGSMAKSIISTTRPENDKQRSVQRRTQKPTNEEPEQEQIVEDDTPLSTPYTTAASTFLYGSNAVLAALKARRRKLYQLYLHPRLSSREVDSKVIRDLARQAGLTIHQNANLMLLDKMSEQRPHNGVVLEASKLPAPPVLALGKPDTRTAILSLELDRQSAEDVAVNGAPAAIASLASTWRHPFVVMLDGITDPGNVGNIMRTCHFYGVDAVAIATNTCANLASSTLAKASSGACEAVRILALPKPSNFVYESAKAGWRIYAAVAPPSTRSLSGGNASSIGKSSREASRYLPTSSVSSSSPLAKHPCILMLGAEGLGLRNNLLSRADFFVSIEQGRRESDAPDVGVDSVNVSVATGILVESFMRRPLGAQTRAFEGGLGF